MDSLNKTVDVKNKERKEERKNEGTKEKLGRTNESWCLFNILLR